MFLHSGVLPGSWPRRWTRASPRSSWVCWRGDGVLRGRGKGEARCGVSWGDSFPSRWRAQLPVYCPSPSLPGVAAACNKLGQHTHTPPVLPVPAPVVLPCQAKVLTLIPTLALFYLHGAHTIAVIYQSKNTCSGPQPWWEDLRGLCWTSLIL